jgi:membrane-bound lytic murein transglycosylase F
MKSSHSALTIGFLLVLVALGFVSCQEMPSPTLAEIRKSGELVVLTRNSATTYFYGPRGKEGIEYDMAKDFARHLGVDLEIKTYPNVSGVLEALKEGKGHIAAAGLTPTTLRRQEFAFGPGYQVVQQQVVCRRGGADPDGIADLADVELVVADNTSYEERLAQLKRQYPELDWETSPHPTEELLWRVWRKRVQCTVADSNILAINQRYFPELRQRFPISEGQELAWGLPKGSYALKASLEEWFAELEQGKEMAALRDRYYGHVQIFDYVDIAHFRQRIRSRLPRYKSLFQKAAKKNGFEWTLLAAVAYQESHWRSYARSPTGVRGMMMLTQVTAKSVGVKNRLSAAQSIRGGAAYLRWLKDRLPEHIEDPDRTWLALAAYNVGYGHLTDARKLARKRGKDPDRWEQLQQVLPLLAQRKYYRQTQYGYARGREPVIYVQRIRQYRHILEKRFGH